MKKETIYLSLPDYSSKFLLSNFNQKINIKSTILLQFKLSNSSHLGSALKALYLLEIIFPRKISVIKLKIKKKKLYFGQKTKDTIFFNFQLTMSSIEFIEFFRFFSKNPLNIKVTKIDDTLVVNKKLKQFEFNNNIFFNYNGLNTSFFYLNFYHLN